MITKVLAIVDLSCTFDLRKLSLPESNVVYNPRKFSSVMWKHKKIAGLCMVFGNGKNYDKREGEICEGMQKKSTKIC